jgi:hypothetical protein
LAARPSVGQSPSFLSVVLPAAAEDRRDMSAPAQKPRPAPVSTMARTFVSALAFSNASRSSFDITAVQALSRSGRLSVTVATLSRTT